MRAISRRLPEAVQRLELVCVLESVGELREDALGDRGVSAGQKRKGR